MQVATLCFLLRGDEICLGMKKIGFGAGKWNGFGGKVGDKTEHQRETVEEAVRREGREEFGVGIKDLEKVAEIRFDFPHNQDWGQYVHVFLCQDWEGEPAESNELLPRWFKITDLPFGQMWADDEVWLPLLLEGKKLQARFIFGDKENIIEQELEIIGENHRAGSKEILL